MSELTTKELFDKWQETAGKIASYYKMGDKEQDRAIRAEWADDLVEAWTDKLVELQDQIHSQPVTSWQDVAILGVVSLGWQASSTFDGKVEDLASSYAMSRSNAYLIRAVGIMAQREGVSPLIAEADFNKGLLDDDDEEREAA